jgi:hypothetical protein
VRTSGPQKPKAFVLMVNGDVVAYGSREHVEHMKDSHALVDPEGKDNVKIQEAPDTADAPRI